MQEKVLGIRISEVIYTNIAYLIRKILDAEYSIDLAYSGLFDSNFRLLSSDLRVFNEEMTLDVFNVMKQYLGDTQTYASLYRMLPSIIRDFIEAEPPDLFILGNKMPEAVQSSVALKKIVRLTEKRCEGCTMNSENCFIGSTRKIMVESGLF